MVSPRLTSWRDFDNLLKVVDVLDEYGKVNRSCGMHIHIEIKDGDNKQVKKLMKFLTKYEKAINSILAPSRRGYNDYAYDSFRDEINLKEVFGYLNGKSLRGLLRYDRFTGRGKWNFKNFIQHGTFENRAHQGTLCSAKVEQWVFLTQAIVSCAFDCRGQVIRETDTTKTYDIFSMLKVLKKQNLIDKSTVAWYKRRHRILNETN